MKLIYLHDSQRHAFFGCFVLSADAFQLKKILKRDYAAFSPNLTDDQSKGRVDIRYRTNGGQHIIVELKRAKRKLSVHELAEQGNKYRTALIKCLGAQNVHHPHISIVFVIGTALSEEADPGGRAMIEGTLNAIGGRVTHYEALIDGARAAYGDFLVESAKADKIDKILQS